MPKSVLTRGRKIVARLTALAMVASIMVIGALPASAAIDTSATCPSSTPSAGFVDIAAYPAATQTAINCLVSYDISQGTSATTYSPQMDVSRWQMALFLTRQAEVHGLTLGNGADQGFTDIAAYPAATQTAINQLAQLDITQGTTATTYSPAAPVTRWQMALFLTRLLDAAGYTLGNGVSQGFTDIGAYPASTQIAINQVAQAGVADGFTATTFGPGQNTLRSQMALFLTRTLAADGVLPSGAGFVVTAFNLGTDVITYDDAGTSKTVDYTGGTAFTVDGASASIGVFEANLSVGDKIAFTGTSFALTNVSVSGGLVNDVDLGADTFDIVLASGAVLTNDRTYVAANTTYSVDGVVASAGGFENSLSVGDTVAISGAGTVASPYVFALTNATATGTVSGVVGNEWNITTAGGAVLGPIDLDVPGTDTLTLSVGGAAATQATFDAALSNGDAVTYGRAAAVVTASLTNQATAPQTGRVLSFDTGADTVTFDAGPATAVTTADYDTGGTFTLRVNGSAVTPAEFEAALNVGDTVTYQAVSTTPAVTASISLTNNTVSGTPSSIVAANDTISIKFDANGPGSADIDYTDQVDPNIVNFAGIAGNLTVTYQVNGGAATVEQFETAVAGITTGLLTGSVAVSDSGTVTVWSVTSP